MTLRLDPTPIPLGFVYDLPNGCTVWHYPVPPADATDDAIDYRRRRMADLDLRGHRVIETMQELADLLSEERANDSTL